MGDEILTESDFYSSLGNRIKAARRHKKMGQEDLGRILDLTRTSIVNIEKGRQRLSLYQLMLLAARLEVSLNELVPPFTETSQLSIRTKNLWEEIKRSNEVVEDQKENIMNFLSYSQQLKNLST